MSQRDEWKKSLESEIEQCKDFLGKAKDISDLVPSVEERKKEAEAKLFFVTNMPEPIIVERSNPLFNFQKHDEELLNSYLPGLPAIHPETAHYLVSGTSTSSGYLNIVQTYRHSGAAIDSSPSSLFSEAEMQSMTKVYVVLSELANEKAKKETLPPRLNKINKELGDKFTVAQKNYGKAKNAIVGIDQSAIQLRDILEQLWGGLVNFVREKDPRKYKGVELNLDTKGTNIVVECLAPDEISKQKLILILETITSIKQQLSDSQFGKNPLAKDMEKLTVLYDQWIIVIDDIVNFIYLNLNIGD